MVRLVHLSHINITYFSNKNICLQIRRKERNEAHLYMNVNVVLEEAFDGHQGNDLYDPERAHYRVFRVRKLATVAELMEMLAENFKFPLKQLRAWPFSARSNQVSRLNIVKTRGFWSLMLKNR